MADCASCGASLVWAMTTTGKRMPLDVVKVPGGKWIISDTTGLLIRRPSTIPMGYEVHWATCPNSNQHRRPRERQ